MHSMIINEFVDGAKSLKIGESPPECHIIVQLAQKGYDIIRIGKLSSDDSCDLPQVLRRPYERGFTVRYHDTRQSLLQTYILSAGIILSGRDFVNSYRQKYESISDMLSQCPLLSDFYLRVYDAYTRDIG